jgi:condensin complex subunit 2
MQTHKQDGDLTNFQAASCTLEASTKIYSCRVDSVHEDTFKILGGLNRTAEGGEGVAKDEDGGGKSEEAKKKAVRRHGVNTLEGNPDNLDVKKFDLEFDVDPLFRKTSAAFDEGGARGLLLNHLSVGYGGDIVFDSIDAVNVPPSSSATTETLCDLSDFQGMKAGVPSSYCTHLLSSHLLVDFLDLLDKVRSAVRDSEICPSFSNFHFSKVATLPNVKKVDSGDEEPMLSDFGDQGDDDDLLDAIQQEEDMMEQIRDSASIEEDGENGETFEVRETGLRRNKEHGVVVSTANGIRNKHMFPEVEYCLAMADAEEVSVDMTKLLQNWAGPEHWKFTSAAKDKHSSTSATSEEGEAKKPKQKKKAFFIDFFGPEVDSEKAFAPPGKASTTLSSANLEKATAAATTLPPDIHYDLSELTRLFLKPNWAIRLPSAWRQSRDNNNPNNSEFIAGVTEGTNFIQMGDDYDDDDEGGRGQDDDERHLAFAAGGDCFEGADLVAQPKKVEHISINYAKVAKKVDVKSLKSNIWSGLSDLTTPLEVCQFLFFSLFPNTHLSFPLSRKERNQNRGRSQKCWMLFLEVFQKRHWKTSVFLFVSFVCFT